MFRGPRLISSPSRGCSCSSSAVMPARPARRSAPTVAARRAPAAGLGHQRRRPERHHRRGRHHRPGRTPAALESAAAAESGTGGATTRTCPVVIQLQAPRNVAPDVICTVPQTVCLPVGCPEIPELRSMQRRWSRSSEERFGPCDGGGCTASAAQAAPALAALDPAVPVAAVEPEASRPGHEPARQRRRTSVRQRATPARLVVESVTRRK